MCAPSLALIGWLGVLKSQKKMKTKEITIGGKTYPVAFSMKTMLNYEEISGKSFFGETFDHLKERIAIIMSAALTADENTTLTVEELMNGDEWEKVKDILAAYNTVMELCAEFMKIPAVEPQPEKPSEDEEEKAKN
jgi:hypothetical protein